MALPGRSPRVTLSASGTSDGAVSFPAGCGKFRPKDSGSAATAGETEKETAHRSKRNSMGASAGRVATFAIIILLAVRSLCGAQGAGSYDSDRLAAYQLFHSGKLHDSAA